MLVKIEGDGAAYNQTYNLFALPDYSGIENADAIAKRVQQIFLQRASQLNFSIINSSSTKHNVFLLAKSPLSPLGAYAETLGYAFTQVMGEFSELENADEYEVWSERKCVLIQDKNHLTNATNYIDRFKY